MITPFNQDGSVDEAAGCRLVQHLIDHGVHPFILGTTGESASMSHQQRLKFSKAICKCVQDRALLYAGIADNCLENSITAAKEYADMGINVVVAHLPAYYPITQSNMLHYYEKLAEKSPVPLMIYNIPATTNLSIPLEIVEILSHHDNVVGLKDSERDSDRMNQAISSWKDRKDFSLFYGWGAQCTNSLLNGADGIVPSTGNLVPGMYRQLYDAAIAGDSETAFALQEKTDRISRVYQANKVLSQSLAALKILLAEYGLCQSFVLPPFFMLEEKEERQVIEHFYQLKDELSFDIDVRTK